MRRKSNMKGHRVSNGVIGVTLFVFSIQILFSTTSLPIDTLSIQMLYLLHHSSITTMCWLLGLVFIIICKPMDFIIWILIEYAFEASMYNSWGSYTERLKISWKLDILSLGRRPPWLNVVLVNATNGCVFLRASHLAEGLSTLDLM